MSEHSESLPMQTQATVATGHTQDSGAPSASAVDNSRSGARAGSSMVTGDLGGSLIGRFMILRKLGEGGMGQVYAAYDNELDRKVAIKLLRGSNYESSTARARLMREAQALAKLSHPNVVQVHEVGPHQNGMFIAMEYVAGHTLRDYFAQAPERSWRDKLATLVQAGHGLAAAHDKKLVHRDFKPDNVMVESSGRVRVLDFGLVRDLEPQHMPESPSESDSDSSEVSEPHPLGGGRQLTRTGAIMGTPAYMALEQLEGKRADASTDQFSFCVVVYEALYGERPFAGDTAAAVAARMYAGEIRPRPNKSEVPRRVHDAIVRGLAAKPSDRWPDMHALLAEFEASLEQLQRGWVFIGLGAVAALVMLVMIGTPLIRDALAKRDQRIAEQGEDLDARALELEAAAAELERRNAELQRQFDVQAGLTATLLADSPGRSVEALTLAIDVYGRYRLRGEEPPLAVEAGLFAATRRLHHSRELFGHTERIVALAFSPDGTRFATASRDDTAKLWDPATGELLRTLSGHVDDLRSIEFSPDGARVLTTSADATAMIWMAETGKVLATIDDYDVSTARFSRDDRSLAVGAEDGSLSLWSAAPGEEIVEQRSLSVGARIDALAFSPDSSRLAAATQTGQLHLWAGTSEIERISVGKVDARTLRFSPDGSRLAVAGVEGSIELRDGASGSAIATLAAAHGEVHALVFSPTEPRLLSTGREGSPKLWRTDTGELVATIEGHREAATDVAFAPDGETFATVSYDSRVRIGDTTTGHVFEQLEGQLGVLERVVYSPDGAHLVSLGSDRTVRLWSPSRINETILVGGRSRELGAIAFSPDRTRVLAGERGGHASVWATEGDARGQMLLDLDHAGATIYSAAFSPDGARVATGDTAGLARIWATESGELLHQLGPHSSDVKALGFSPEAKLLASADLNGHVRLWDVASGALVREWAAGEQGVSALAFSPDGASLATAGLLGTVSTWNVGTGQREHLLAVEGLLFTLAYSPDGHTLAVAGTRKQVELWDVATQARVGVLASDDPVIDSVAFSPDGRRVITGGDAWVRMWDAASALHLANFATHDAKLLAVGFSPDGMSVLGGSADGQVRISVADAEIRASRACRALRGNRGYAAVEPTCEKLLE